MLWHRLRGSSTIAYVCFSHARVLSPFLHSLRGRKTIIVVTHSAAVKEVADAVFEMPSAANQEE